MTVSALSDLDEEEIRVLAGDGAFARGEAYFHEGRVRLTQSGTDALEAIAEGTSTYRLGLRNLGGGLDWHCDCPAAANGSFCKHLVAAGLSWLAGASGEAGVFSSGDGLLEALRERSVEELATWLHEAALRDSGLELRLRSRLGQHSKDELKSVVSEAISVRGFLDFDRTMDYAMDLDDVLELLEGSVEADPVSTVELCEYTVKRLLKIYERADDSSGMLGDRVADLARLHARAVRQAGAGGVSLAGRLYRLKQKDEWDLFPLADYWDALGKKGQAAYARRVEKAYQALPEPSAEGRKRFLSGEAFQATYQREELAKVQGDLETLIAIHSRDLSFPAAYERIIQACRDHGRELEAMHWAENGVKAHPDSAALRVLLAEELGRAGLEDEAADMLFSAFCRRPDYGIWKQLRRMTGSDWSRWRTEALDVLASRERRTDDGLRDVTERVDFLWQDGDLSGAVELAHEHRVWPDTLARLAEAIKTKRPADAGAFFRRVVDTELEPAKSTRYPSIVRLMKKARACDPGPATDGWLDELRVRYARRPSLMRRMDKAGL
jgi:hypothetical protein